MTRHGSMNHIFRLVWSPILSGWVAVAENACGHGKGASRKLLRASLALTTFTALSASAAYALPTDAHLVLGSASITQSGSVTTIRQTSQNLALNWNSFDIAAQETVNFVQPTAAAIAVNRIFDTNATQIFGHLNANGQVYLINPNGIVFERGAQVNVGALVASTLDLSNASLNGNTRAFSGSATGHIANQGSITVSDGGYVALLGNQVSNQGVITAQLGSVVLGAGSAVTLNFNGNSLLGMQIDQNLLAALAENGAVIKADGGLVIMAAGAKDALMTSVVNNTGLIQAQTVANHAGTITLLGGMAAGSVNVNGTLDASAPKGGNGGFIETSAAHMNVADGANVSTVANAGNTGNWLIDPSDYTVAATGGNQTGASLLNALNHTNVTLLSSSGSPNGYGNIYVNDAVTWRHNTLTLNAQNNIIINSSLLGSDQAKLSLLYGQATAAGGDATYYLNNKAYVTLPAGLNFSTKLGTASAAINYTVVTKLGNAQDAQTAPAVMSLQGIAASGMLSGNYVLGGAINASSTKSWNGGAGFMPIGTLGDGFVGNFDGLGNTISNLTINLPAVANVGLFGYTGSTIQNVNLKNVNVAGAAGTGALVGNLTTGAVLYSSVTSGSVEGAAGTGGLVGSMTSGSMTSSFATVSVSGAAGTGGLLGSNTSGAINDGHAYGAVTGAAGSGGLVGSNTSGAISHVSASGNVNGAAGSGGLVGSNTSGAINDGQAYGAVTGAAGSGGLVGSNTSGAISNSSAKGNVTGAAGSGGLVGSDTSGALSNDTASGKVVGAAGTGALYGSITSGVITDSAGKDWGN